ncbi:thiamine pyrophosphate-dependent enzyme [Niabella sp. W65]|nr:thiamine pyrophosphate-dependent enzyme [Niabella sp. W65]MCH7365241.1 thiamine pyrophosphate-dependent enzyme [Niabella sp. W65]ULT46576.1 thiamine pyrophosphate-dependent enzyme [Niabella sp. I65]
MEGKIRGFFHAYVGQEAIAAGCMTATRPDDMFITAYRDHGLAIAKGVSVDSCMAELYGKATGCAKGKGGSMHFLAKRKLLRRSWYRRCSNWYRHRPCFC